MLSLSVDDDDAASMSTQRSTLPFDFPDMPMRAVRPLWVVKRGCTIYAEQRCAFNLLAVAVHRPCNVER